MDSFTQAVLGGAVGHAAAGDRLGRRAAVWGAAAGTLPDLDVLAYPFLDTAGELLVHRGVTHGFAFGLVVGPALGWAGWRLAQRAASRSDPASRSGSGAGRAAASRAAPDAWRAWVALWTLALVTHPLLDTFTVYGTQLLAPFSKHPFAIGSVFIIDPLYTVPLLALLVVAVVRSRPSVGRRRARRLDAVPGVERGGPADVVRAEVVPRLPGAERVLVTPAPLQTLLWRVEVERAGSVEPYRYALLDRTSLEPDGPPSRPASFPPGLEGTRGVETLRWFSRGWLVRPDLEETDLEGADLEGGGLGGDGPGVVVADARFGRGPGGAHVFRWRVAPDGSLEQLPFEARLDGAYLRGLFDDAFSRR